MCVCDEKEEEKVMYYLFVSTIAYVPLDSHLVLSLLMKKTYRAYEQQ